MNTSQAIEKLSKRDSLKRTKAGIFRELFPHIESAIRSGMSRMDALEILNECGLQLTFQTFCNYLHRVRKTNTKQNITKGVIANKQLGEHKSIGENAAEQMNKSSNAPQAVKQLSGREALEAAMYNKDVAKLFNKPRRKNT